MFYVLLRSKCYFSRIIFYEHIEPIKFIFGMSELSHPGKKLLEFEKNCPRVRMGVVGPNFGANDKRQRKNSNVYNI